MTSMDQEKLEKLKKELEKFKKGEKIEGRSRTTPLGKLFNEISNKLSAYQSQTDAVKYLYNQFTDNDVETQIDQIQMRDVVISQVLEYFDKINELSMKKKDSTIISIPLYDIRIVGDLTNIILLHGIYSIIPNEYLVPLNMRMLKNFKASKTFIKIDFEKGLFMLDKILEKFTKIFESDSDLKDILLVGTGFTDILTIAVVLYSKLKTDQYLSYLDRLETLSSTYQLLSFYSILYKYSLNSGKNAQFTKYISSLLCKTLMKPNGVQSLIDLVMGLREDEDIDIAKIPYVVQIIVSSKPQTCSIVQYYTNIFDQIERMLVFIDRPLMNTVLTEIIINIYQKNNQIIIDFLFKKIWEKLNPEIRIKNGMEDSDIVIINGVELNNAFNVCISLSRSFTSTNKEILNEFIEPILLPLWYYANHQRKSNKSHTIILNVLKNVLILGNFDHFMNLLISNIVEYKPAWKFDNASENNLTYIKLDTNESPVSKESFILDLFDRIDFNVATLIELSEILIQSDSKYMNKILIDILNQLVNYVEISEVEIPIKKVVILKLLQSVIENFKSQIENEPISLLIFTNTYFSGYFDTCRSKLAVEDIYDESDSDDEDEYDVEISQNDELINSLLPILDILSNLTFFSEEEKIQLEKLQSMFEHNKKFIPRSIAVVVDKILKVDPKQLTIKKDENNEFNVDTILKQANDPTPSIKVFALDKLTKQTMLLNDTKVLNTNNNSITTKYTITLLVSQLRNSEPFVYLNAIKNLVSLISFDKSYTNYILELYSQSKKSIDEKLRLGEVLTQFISMDGKLLTPDIIRDIVTTCINISRSNSELQEKYKDNKDVKLKMSALSILGLICFETGFGIMPYVDEIADLVQGIVNFEKDAELRRAAVVIINDIVRNDKGLEIIQKHGKKLQILLEYVAEKDQDLLVCQFANNTLAEIEESFQRKFTDNLKLK